ncbi:hypothetical protein [Gellertiella hungarica]|uniref:Uncharacterized protein n=1 Tax=Gellertiella hungarica TaxID=1572859 RepID=A0A7W6JBI4_9HYPH|nr:hypothetical protein [Gellertiella hungarica]
MSLRCSYFSGIFANEPMGSYTFIAAAMELEATCYHEASHAVAEYVFGYGLQSIRVDTVYSKDADGNQMVTFGGEVRRRSRGNGHVSISYGYRPSVFMMGCIAAAGPAGERRYRHEKQIPMRMLGATEGDHQTIDAIAKSLERRGRCRQAFQRHVWSQAQKLVACNDVWIAVSEVAGELYYNGNVTDDQDAERVSQFITPADVYRICRQNGLKRGMLRVA